MADASVVESPGLDVAEVHRLTLNRPNRLGNMYLLSPFVWRADDRYELMLRAVWRRDDDPRMKVSEIWHGRSEDGFNFAMDVYPIIYPGPEIYDLDGCEDPTVIVDGGQLNIWYAGYNAGERTGRLIYARGRDLDHVAKVGLAIGSRPPFENPKEAELLPTDGGWRMMYEYAEGGLSCIGQCDCEMLDGPWTNLRPAPIQRREGMWDDGHLSPGPMRRRADGTVLAFYNGGSANANQRVGWAILDPAMERVLARSETPLIVPPRRDNPAATDIAFVSSLVDVEDGYLLYFSISDMDLRCAKVSVAG